MTITHHPQTETLATYAAGALDEARMTVLATHLEFCETCRIAARDFETLGGLALEDAEPCALSDGAAERFWRRAEAEPTASPVLAQPSLARARPLSERLEGGLDGVRWRPIGAGMAQSVLKAEGYRPGVLRLLKIAPGVKMPTHGHRGGELTVLLRGFYEDEVGVFGPGDLADLDEATTHAPRASGNEPCICLIATGAPLVFKGVIGRLIQPFVGL